MSTRSNLKRSEIGSSSPLLFNRVRTTIETAFYRNNVIKISSLAHAYELAKNASGTIISDLPVHNAEELGLPTDATVLIFNDGIITGRNAKIRRIVNETNADHFGSVLRNSVFNSRKKTMYHAVAYVGLHEDFMVKAHLLIPEGYENTLYSWLLNFQNETNSMDEMYSKSKKIDEGDIFLYSDPDEFIEDFEIGISIFDHDNCGALLGLKYFGEHKKATLTMAWSVASRSNYTACHGGQKRFNLDNDKKFIAGVFGLSGSGKSTITHSKHNGKFDVSVLHDDAFIISNKDGSSISMEPAYFDKVQDYPTDSKDNKFLLTMQNVGVTIDNFNKIVPVTEDIRNGNGRCLKSIYWTPKRVYKFDKKADAIFWIMKDDTLPPILKVESSILGSTLGATLATKRSSAEYGAIQDKLIIEPYANPFRLYSLKHDYNNFKHLFETTNVDCYVLNTGDFQGKDITKDITLNLIERIVSKDIKFSQLGHVKELQYVPIKGFNPDFEDKEFKELFIQRIRDRISFLEDLSQDNHLPSEAIQSLQKVIIDTLN